MRGGVLRLEVDDRLVEVEDRGGDRLHVLSPECWVLSGCSDPALSTQHSAPVMPDFQTVIIRVIVVCSLSIGVGFTGLYFVFRSFDSNSERRPVLLGSALLLFIFTCCLLLYIVSR